MILTFSTWTTSQIGLKIQRKFSDMRDNTVDCQESQSKGKILPNLTPEIPEK